MQVTISNIYEHPVFMLTILPFFSTQVKQGWEINHIHSLVVTAKIVETVAKRLLLVCQSYSANNIVVYNYELSASGLVI